MSSIAPEILTGLSEYFKRCVRGYHLVNAEPIKESVWEAINTQVLTHSGCTVFSQASGSHSPGSDISSSIGNFSNKSVKYDGKVMDISSYRLTAACATGDLGEIIAEIKRRKNFQYYSIIAREEHPDKIQYDWFILPADHPAVNPEAYTWSPMLGKRGKNKGSQIGWQTNTVNGSSMSITFSMSSQLWMSVSITDEMREQCIVARTQATQQPIMDYVQLAAMYPEEK